MKQTVELDLKWYTLHQNNSGGVLEVNSYVADYVMVQATSAQEATDKFLSIIDKYSRMGSCDCCGSRWYVDVYEEDATDEPAIYGKPLDEYEPYSETEIRLHYYDGRVEARKLFRKGK